MADKAYIGIDVGGTFTDVVLLKGKDMFIAKVPSTPSEPDTAVINGIEKVLKETNTKREDVERVIHGSTVAINAILQKKGVTTAILMTNGFEDTIAIGRQDRSSRFDLFLDPETPEFIAPKGLRAGIIERIDSGGNIVVPLNEKQVEDVVLKFKDLYDIKAMVVCYLFSFLNPVHELRTKEIIERICPDIRVSLSSQVEPVLREYERLCITCFDAYIGPPVNQYLTRLERKLAGIGIKSVLQIMGSRGGVTISSMAKEKPISMIMSGPGAGVVGGHFVGLKAAEGIENELENNKNNFITIDIGGTSCDAALIHQGKWSMTKECKVATYPINRTAIDVNSIGAGGGSIAWLDAAGSLRVGPQSAGANPGPACYMKGGNKPTVTDASVVLGYISPEYFCRGEMRLNPDLAMKVISEIAKPIGMDAYSVAFGIHQVINAKIADQIRLLTIRRGYDPREFTLLAFGGAGAIHAGLIAKELAIPLCIIPAFPGVTAALGLHVAKVEHENSMTCLIKQAGTKEENRKQSAAFRTLIDKGNKQMKRENVPIDKVCIDRYADMRYAGQSFEVEIPLEGNINSKTLDKAMGDFEKQHELVYGYRRKGSDIEFVNLRVVHSYAYQPPPWKKISQGYSLAKAKKEDREIYIGEWVKAPVYRRDKLMSHKSPVNGPAIIEGPDSTIVVYQGQTFSVDSVGNILIRTHISQEVK